MSIKENVSLYALEIGRMIGLDRRLTEAEAASLYEQFICSSRLSSNSMRFGDFLAWCMVHIDKSDARFA